MSDPSPTIYIVDDDEAMRDSMTWFLEGEGYAVTDRTIDAHIKALRKKLTSAGADPELIETERGIGYRLQKSG